MNWVRKLKKLDLLLFLKASFGSAIAIILANRLNLAYSSSAGIITLLTLQNTKLETISITGKRILAFMIALILAYPIFNSLGYTTVAFGGFIFLFVGICNILGLQDGIVMNAVLVTHFLIEKRMDPSMVINEIGILAIGMSVGIILNLIMIDNSKKIRRDQEILETKISDLLRCFSNILLGDRDCLVDDIDEDVDFKGLDIMLDDLLLKAYEDAGNRLLTETKYQISFLEMRKLQVVVLKGIFKSIKEIDGVFPQSVELSLYIEKMAGEFHELNTVETLIIELEKLNDYYKKDKLPVNRNEFENRAILFNILKDLEHFLDIKRTFIEKTFAINKRKFSKN